MNDKKAAVNWSDKLRQQAESILARLPDQDAENVKADFKEVLQDLHVHQIELELQNEELQRTQERLQHSRDRYLYFYHSAPCGYIVLNSSGYISETNQTFADMVGLPLEEVNATPLADYLQAEDKAVFLGRLRAFFRQPQGKHMELRLIGRGTATDVSIQVAPPLILNEHAGYSETSLLVTIHDISEHKKLAEIQAQLEKDASLLRVASAVAHNYNNLLTTITWSIEMIQETAQEEERAAFIDSTLESCDRLRELGVMLLAYLGYDAKQEEVVDLNLFGRKIIGRLQAEAEANCTLEFVPAQRNLKVSINEESLEQSCLPLLTNAIESLGKTPGTVTLSITQGALTDSEGDVRFPPDWEPGQEDFAIVSVADTGCGISAKAMRDVFDPYYSDKFLGRGMGLPIALSIARAGGGCITARSTPGEGSCFTIVLPVHEP